MPARRDARRPAVAILALASVALPATALAGSGGPAAVGVHLPGLTALVKVESATVLLDRGTITGSPIGSGRISLTYTLHPSAGLAVTTFTIVNARGTVTGRARSSYDVTRLHITFTGVGSLTGGTGAYAGLRARRLQFDALHSIVGKKAAVALIGRATRS
jgi:hypothetical protein